MIRPPCRFGCSAPACGLYWLPEGLSTPHGCVCWPDPVQALCAQHLDRAQTGGPIHELLRYGPPMAEMACGGSGR